MMKANYRNYTRRSLLSTGVSFALLLSGSVAGQDNVGDESTVRYEADYFTQFAPVTAQDMLDRIPGVSSGGGFGGGPGSGGASRGGRGFGSGSGGNQILINGKRTAGKNNSTGNQLDSITTDQVNYIEIIRGTSGDLDVRGSGQVINVVLFEALSTSSISFEANADRYADGELQPGGSFSYSGQSGALNYVFSAAAEPRYDNQISKENSVLGDFSPNDLIREDRVRDQTSYDLSMNLDYAINGNSSARFNALFSQNDNPTDIFRQTTDLRVSPNVVSLQREAVPGEQDNWEIGGDYEYRTGTGNRFKILFISNEDNRAATRERFNVQANGSEEKDLFLATSAITQERIVRGSWTMDVTEGQDIEFGAEGAQTILDSSLALGLAGITGDPSAAFGGLVPVAVSNANSRVEEIRYEPFLIHNWIINPKMSLETTVLHETSEITQSGDVNKSRNFDFVKPKVDFRYDLTPTLQLRGSIEKVVRQLSFSDFVASNDEQDNDRNTFAGNADLRQEFLWKYDLNAEYRFPDDIGVMTANLFYHDHRDKIDRIDVSPSEDDLQSANGNIGDGTMWGMNLSASIRMKMINMPNLLVTSNVNVQDSEIEDPLLGIERRFANLNRGRNSLGFRHDLPRWNMNYGFTWNNRFDGNIKRYDIDDIELSAGDPFTLAFVEYRDKRGITYRLDSRNVFSGLSCRERQRFVGRVSANILEEIEDNCSGSGRVVSLKINGTF